MSSSQYCDNPNTAQPASNASLSQGNGTSGRRSPTTSLSESDDEEQDETPSPLNNDVNLNVQELSTFRTEWKNEISSTLEAKVRSNSLDNVIDGVDNLELNAKNLYLKGAEFERNGSMYEAIKFYRKAVQLVPDIELKLYEESKKSNILEQNAHTTIPVDSPESQKNRETIDDDSQDEEDEDLLLKFQRWHSRSLTLCAPAVEQSTTHISSLPLEIVLLIFRWVVSRDLDIRSLEMCGLVCRGFYMCSRDSELWRLICLRIWRSNCGGLTNHDSWLNMYRQRPHLRFNGCYISKTTYYRQGENSFQDRSYRPVHVVEYYRYFRFFPEGTVLVMNTPEAPASAVGHLRYRDTKHPAVMVGRFRLSAENSVSYVVSLKKKSNRSNRSKPDQITTHKGNFMMRLYCSYQYIYRSQLICGL